MDYVDVKALQEHKLTKSWILFQMHGLVFLLLVVLPLLQQEELQMVGTLNVYVIWDMFNQFN